MCLIHLHKILFSFFLALISLAIISSLGIAQTFTPPSSYQPLELTEGALLYKQQLPDGNEAYLQVINLQKMQIDQLVGEVDNMGLGQGRYYKGEGKYYSPFFKMKLFEEVANEYKQLYGEAVFSLINCSFFEQYKSSSQLSFPIKFNGVVITGGHSPYGPIKQPASSFYSNIRLKALVWDDSGAYITDYDPTTGAPLDRSSVKNAIVSYQYSDHPAKVLAQSQVNRYHVIGTLDFDGIKGDELLLIMTVNRARLDQAADLLRQLGVKGNIITIDGGSSTYLLNSRQGNIILPQPANQEDNPTYRQLPHYLGFRTRVKKQVEPLIKISQPAGQAYLEKNKPYLILWRDNLDSEVTIELYEGDKRIQVISPHTKNDGVYEWTPSRLVKKGYSVRISSLKNPKIFGTLQLQRRFLSTYLSLFLRRSVQDVLPARFVLGFDEFGFYINDLSDHGFVCNLGVFLLEAGNEALEVKHKLFESCGILYLFANDSTVIFLDNLGNFSVNVVGYSCS